MRKLVDKSQQVRKLKAGVLALVVVSVATIGEKLAPMI